MSLYGVITVQNKNCHLSSVICQTICKVVIPVPTPPASLIETRNLSTRIVTLFYPNSYVIPPE